MIQTLDNKSKRNYNDHTHIIIRSGISQIIGVLLYIVRGVYCKHLCI